MRSGAGVLGRAVYRPCLSADGAGVLVLLLVLLRFSFSGETSSDMSAAASSDEGEFADEVVEVRV